MINYIAITGSGLPVTLLTLISVFIGLFFSLGVFLWGLGRVSSARLRREARSTSKAKKKMEERKMLKDLHRNLETFEKRIEVLETLLVEKRSEEERWQHERR